MAPQRETKKTLQNHDAFILGGQHADSLEGGVGNDLLLGGAGHDTYLFNGDYGIDILTDSDGDGSLLVEGRAMQFYYEGSAKALDANQQLFIDLGTAGEGNNGLRFDVHDVSRDLAAAQGKVDSDMLAQWLKGYAVFLDYVQQSGRFSADEMAYLKHRAPRLRDWTIQAGDSLSGGMVNDGQWRAVA